MQISAPLLWLLKHLDNPYPSLATKRSLCKQSGLSLKVLAEWFSHTRRRIGWTSISKRYFEGDRQMTRDCIHRVLFEPSRPLGYSKEIIESVENMKMVAERLHAKKFKRTIHASRHVTTVGLNDRLEMSSSTRPLDPTYPACLLQDDNTTICQYVSDVQAKELRTTDQCPNNTGKKRPRDSCSADTQDGEAMECSRPIKKLKCVIFDDLNHFSHISSEHPIYPIQGQLRELRHSLQYRRVKRLQSCRLLHYPSRHFRSSLRLPP